MEEAKFGPAGHSDSYAGKSADAAAWLAERGLTAFEYQCGHGVSTGQATAEKIGEAMARHGIALSVHAPYFISLANPENLDKNIGYLRQSCTLAKQMGARRIVVHPGSALGAGRSAALASASETMKRVLEAASEEGWDDVVICLETMGKTNQLGTLDEIMALCGLSSTLLPCVDFGHLYARSLGKVNGRDEFAAVLKTLAASLGFERAKSFHMHFSRIEYSKGGEKKHRTFADSGGFGPDWEPLAELLAKGGFTPVVICESRGTQAEDAAAMSLYYRSLLQG